MPELIEINRRMSLIVSGMVAGGILLAVAGALAVGVIALVSAYRRRTP